MRAVHFGLGAVLLSLSIAPTITEQGKRSDAKPNEASSSELSKLRDEYIKATQEYKASLERLLVLYQESTRKAEQRVAQSEKLLAENLITDREVERSRAALAEANLKVSGV